MVDMAFKLWARSFVAVERLEWAVAFPRRALFPPLAGQHDGTSVQKPRLVGNDSPEELDLAVRATPSCRKRG
jgi:hypothetical protein